MSRHWKGIKPFKAVEDSDRAIAKELCYAIIYGAGEKRVAESMNTDVSIARKHLEDFKEKLAPSARHPQTCLQHRPFGRYKMASEFKELVQRDCSRSDMTVRTLLGRQRLVDRIYTQAVNTVIQVARAPIV